ncbi:hypothetical protein SB781_40125, partial [Paraburkholderia sp. SIMBA_061]
PSFAGNAAGDTYAIDGSPFCFYYQNYWLRYELEVPLMVEYSVSNPPQAYPQQEWQTDNAFGGSTVFQNIKFFDTDTAN